MRLVENFFEREKKMFEESGLSGEYAGLDFSDGKVFFVYQDSGGNFKMGEWENASANWEGIYRSTVE